MATTFEKIARGLLDFACKDAYRHNLTHVHVTEVGEPGTAQLTRCETTDGHRLLRVEFPRQGAAVGLKVGDYTLADWKDLVCKGRPAEPTTESVTWPDTDQVIPKHASPTSEGKNVTVIAFDVGLMAPLAKLAKGWRFQCTDDLSPIRMDATSDEFTLTAVIMPIRL